MIIIIQIICKNCIVFVLVLNPNTLGGNSKVYGGKPRLSYINHALLGV